MALVVGELEPGTMSDYESLKEIDCLARLHLMIYSRSSCLQIHEQSAPDYS